MKLSILPLTLALACACSAPTTQSTVASADSTAARSETRVEANVESLVKACQERGEINFTYSKATHEALVATPVDADDMNRVPAKDVESFATEALERYGFACRPIGPPHLHVLLIERKSS